MEKCDRIHSMAVDYEIVDKDRHSFPPYEDLYIDDEPSEQRSPEEKRLQRLQVNRARTAQRRAQETDQERALRLYKNKVRNKRKRAAETPEQRAERNRRNTERNRSRRMRERGLSFHCPFSMSDIVKTELPPSPEDSGDVCFQSPTLSETFADYCYGELQNLNLPPPPLSGLDSAR